MADAGAFRAASSPGSTCTLELWCRACFLILEGQMNSGREQLHWCRVFASEPREAESRSLQPRFKLQSNMVFGCSAVQWSPFRTATPADPR